MDIKSFPKTITIRVITITLILIFVRVRGIYVSIANYESRLDFYGIIRGHKNLYCYL